MASEYTDLVKASANQVMAFARAPKGGMYAATSNLGKIFQLGADTAARRHLRKRCLRRRNFSKWGRVEVRGTGKFELYVRSGNVDNPDRNWSPWQKVDTTKELPPRRRRLATCSGRRFYFPAHRLRHSIR